MHLTALECRHFRCLEQVQFIPAPGLNVIRGGNAQGKTSLLEAILYAATSKSHRTESDAELAAHGRREFQLRLSCRRRDRDVTVEANWRHGTKRFKINGVPQIRLSDLLGRVQVVFFSPETIELVKGGASQRRRFLDMELSQINPAYLAALQQYRQALRQRNELLRQNSLDTCMLDVWDLQLVKHGRQLAADRAAYMSELAPLAAEVYQLIAGGEEFAVTYAPDVAAEEDLGAALAASHSRDLRTGATHRGPHRDDIEMTIAGRPARNFASQGQQRTAALALKLAELELVRARVGEYPVLLLDEVLAELDAQRAARLFAGMGEEVQCVVTTTESDMAPKRLDLHRDARLYTIEGGKLEEG